MKCVLCIPIRNAANHAARLLEALSDQSFSDCECLVIDSASTDGSPDLFRAAGCRVQTIPLAEFSHGATRQLAVELCPDAEIIVFMTQDAVLADRTALQKLVDVFENPLIGAAFGRQLPALDATAIAAHARLFNYPTVSYERDKSDVPCYGIKTAFLSNSFAAYRRTALLDVGGFPRNVILSEDTLVAARMLLSGWKLAYCAEAACYHSHNYSVWQEFKRYFDIGVLHGREKWYCQALGAAEGEGIRFVRSEIDYLWHNAPLLIPVALLRTVLKLGGYRLGRLEYFLPVWLKQALSMNTAFWG